MTMTEIEFVEENLKEHKQVLLEFTLNYMHWIQKNVQKMYYVDMFKEVGIPLVEYVNDYVENKSTSDEFKYYLVHCTKANNYIGMGGIRKHTDSIGETCDLNTTVKELVFNC